MNATNGLLSRRAFAIGPNNWISCKPVLPAVCRRDCSGESGFCGGSGRQSYRSGYIVRIRKDMNREVRCF